MKKIACKYRKFRLSTTFRENRIIFQNRSGETPRPESKRLAVEDEIEEKKEATAEKTQAHLEKAHEAVQPYVIHQLIEKMYKPEELKAYLEEYGADTVEDILPEYEDNFQDLEDWKKHFDETYGAGVFGTIKKMSEKKPLSLNDFSSIAGLFIQTGDLLKTAQELRAGGKKFEVHKLGLTEDSHSAKNQMKVLSSWALFDILFRTLSGVEKRHILRIIIGSLKEKLSADQLSRAISDMRDRHILNENDIKALIAEDSQYKFLENSLMKGGNAGWAGLRGEIQKSKAGGSGALPNLNIQMLQHPDPQTTETNFAAKFLSLKNLFLIEYVGRLVALGALLEIVPGVINAAMAKDNNERINAIKQMLTNPYLYAKLGGLALIYENVTSDGKPLGEGIVSSALGVSSEATAGRSIAEELKFGGSDENDALRGKKVIEFLSNGANHKIYGEFLEMGDLTEEDLKAAKERLKTERLTDVLKSLHSNLAKKDIKINITGTELEVMDNNLKPHERQRLFDFMVMVARTSRGASHVKFQRVKKHFEKYFTKTFNPEKKFKLTPDRILVPEIKKPEDAEI